MQMPLTDSVLRFPAALFCLIVFATFATAAEPDKPLDYEVSAAGIHQELSPNFCWFHPRVAAMPGFGKDGKPAIVVTLQKHLAASDHYSGLFVMRTDDLGGTWSQGGSEYLLDEACRIGVS